MSIRNFKGLLGLSWVHYHGCSVFHRALMIAARVEAAKPCPHSQILELSGSRQLRFAFADHVEGDERG